MPRTRIELIGVPFVLSAQRSEDLSYFNGFLRAYTSSGSVPPAARPYEITVSRGRLPRGSRSAPVWIHRTKHPYWRLIGLPTADGWLVWRGRGVATRVDHDAGKVDLVADPSTDARVVGEAAFHVTRSLAFYLRNPSWSVLHASGVVVGESAILFTGDEAAGKTTLMTEAVIHGDAEPFTNDRAFIAARESLRVLSWPAYASFTEGTLLTYPQLTRAAQVYEHPDYPYRTQHWKRPLQPVFTKDRKRIFPPVVFTDVTGKKYRRAAPLRALVFARVHPAEPRTTFARVDLADERERDDIARALRRQLFDTSEPSWHAWHQLDLPEAPVSPATLVSTMHKANVSVYRLRVRPPRYRPVHDLLEQLGTALT